MRLTHCPNCRRRCFTDATSCPNCFQSFQPGLLQAYAEAEEKAFSTKTNMLLLGLFLLWVVAVLLFQLQAQLGGKGN